MFLMIWYTKTKLKQNNNVWILSMITLILQ